MSYIALILDSNLMLLKSKKFKITDKFINYKKETLNIRLDAFLYKTPTTTFYAFIYDTDEKLLIVDDKRVFRIQEKIQKGDLHLLVTESIIGQLARAFLQTVKTNWILIILALAFGIVAGYLACSLISPSQVINVVNATATPTPIIVR